MSTKKRERPFAKRWKEQPGFGVQGPLSHNGPYVISHQHESYTLLFRSPERYHHVESFKTLSQAKKAAEDLHKSHAKKGDAAQPAEHS